MYCLPRHAVPVLRDFLVLTAHSQVTHIDGGGRGRITVSIFGGDFEPSYPVFYKITVCGQDVDHVLDWLVIYISSPVSLRFVDTSRNSGSKTACVKVDCRSAMGMYVHTQILCFPPPGPPMASR